MNKECTVVVIGGGIAGISCIESLFQDFEAGKSRFNRVVLITESRLVKSITSYELRGRQLEWFDVNEELPEIAISANKPEGLEFISIIGKVVRIDSSSQVLVYYDGRANCEQHYDVISLCTGSIPRELSWPHRSLSKEIDERIIIIRDTNTILDLREKLKHCRRVVIVGNGGIGLELVDKIAQCEKIWVIRDDSIGLTFFDSGASKFLLDARRNKLANQSGRSQRPSYSATTKVTTTYGDFGPSLGPDWSSDIELKGMTDSTNSLEIIYNDEVSGICYGGGNFPLSVTTKGDKSFDCDLIISAIGVLPNPPLVEGVKLSLSTTDGGVLIDDQMRTSVKNIYAAGDVVCCEGWTDSELWFQMRLWVQARQMGYYAGKCIVEHLNGRDPGIYFNFDCFTHCTTFFGYRLILLGRYNAQNMNADDAADCEIIARVNPMKDYVKLVIKNSKIIGAVLVGESGLEETIENLIRDQIDISAYKDHILDGTVDIEDYFD